MAASTANLNKSAMSYLTVLLNLIEAKDWKSFEKVALKNPKAFQSVAEIIATSSEFNGMTFLHACARNDPPVRVVAKIIELCPDAPKSCDCLNRTPLHVAAGVGANFSVIKYIVMAYPDACKIQDEDGRTPLHLACDTECQLFEGDEDRARSPPSYDVVRCLLAGSIMPASMEDEDGMSPLEYAICSDADIKVIKLLQKAAQKYMKQTHDGSGEKEKNGGVNRPIGGFLNGGGAA